MRKSLIGLGATFLAFAAIGVVSSPAQATTGDREKPSVAFIDVCDGFTATVTNPLEDSIKVRFGSDNAAVEVAAEGQYSEIVKDTAVLVQVKWKGEWYPFAEHKWKRPGNCNPFGTVDSKCDGSILVTFTNPASLDAEKAKFVAKVRAVKELTPDEETKLKAIKLTHPVAPGESAEIILWAGLEVAWKVNGSEWTPWTEWVKPKDCPTASPSPTPTATEPSETASPAPGGGGGTARPQLPTTGVSVPQAAGIGAGLIGLGAAFLFVLRRRRLVTEA